MYMKKVIIRLIDRLALGGAVLGGYRYFQVDAADGRCTVATTKVQKGDVIVRAYSRGELRAVRSAHADRAESVRHRAGDQARAARLARQGEGPDRRVRRFRAPRALEETLLEVEQIDEQIKKAQADLAIRDNQDQVELLQARYAVRRAELEVKRNELISEIDAKKNTLNLEEPQARSAAARKRYQVAPGAGPGRAGRAAAEAQNKSMIEMAPREAAHRQVEAAVAHDRPGCDQARIAAGFFIFGQQVPDIREGDTLQPGMPVADVLDLSELEVVAKVGELDRANLQEGQEVRDRSSTRFPKSVSRQDQDHERHGHRERLLRRSRQEVRRDLLGRHAATARRAWAPSPSRIERCMATAEANAKKPRR